MKRYMRKVLSFILLLVGMVMVINNDANYIVFNLVGLFFLHLSCKGMGIYYKA